MTTFIWRECTCAVCGSTHEYDYLGSIFAFTAYDDLDFRLNDYRRSLIRVNLHECPDCGYVSKEVSDECPVPAEFLNSSSYQNCDGREFTDNEGGRRYYRKYLIDRYLNNKEAALQDLIHGAWASDDCLDETNVNGFRELALPYIKEEIQNHPENEKLWLIRADLLRRNGRFKELKEEYQDKVFQNDRYNRILALQLKLAEEGDTAAHLQYEALKD